MTTIETVQAKTPSSGSEVLERLDFQRHVLAPTPSRATLAGLSASWHKQRIAIRVHRNHAFEPMQGPLNTFLAAADLEPLWQLSDYDDTLSFTWVEDGSVAPDLELLWLDHGRYRLKGQALADWINGRLGRLRQVSAAPVLMIGPIEPDDELAHALDGIARTHRGVRFAPLNAVHEALGLRVIDESRALQVGSRLSRHAQLLAAQQLGLRFIPAVVKPRIKAIAIDLDNTLYEGVLGEDGVAGIRLTPGHAALQEALVKLGQQGIILSIVSKNEEEDVRQLFNIRHDFPLKHEHLSGVCANWRQKAENIRELAAAFNFDASSFLMLDDNHGELFAAGQAIPGLALLQASEKAEETVAQLALFPGLLTYSADETDRLRVEDIRAKSVRARLAGELDPAAYLSALGTTITLQLDPIQHFQRLCDIPRKTNQFNMALKRLREADVQAYLNDNDKCVVAFELSDRLSNSGNVGAAYFKVSDGALQLDELCISCRALGRGLEDLIVAEAILIAREALATKAEIIIDYRHGPRNRPALTWLERVTGRELEARGDGAGTETAPLYAARVEVSRVIELAALLSSAVTVRRSTAEN